MAGAATANGAGAAQAAGAATAVAVGAASGAGAAQGVYISEREQTRHIWVVAAESNVQQIEAEGTLEISPESLTLRVRGTT